MLLRVLGPAPGVYLVLGPVFPEVAHRGPSLNWSGGHIPIRGAPYVYRLLCVYECATKMVSLCEPIIIGEQAGKVSVAVQSDTHTTALLKSLSQSVPRCPKVYPVCPLLAVLCFP